MWKIYAASESCLLIAEADRVLCHLVMLLPVFLRWIYSETQLLLTFFCYSWLACSLGRG